MAAPFPSWRVPPWTPPSQLPPTFLSTGDTLHMRSPGTAVPHGPSSFDALSRTFEVRMIHHVPGFSSSPSSRTPSLANYWRLRASHTYSSRWPRHTPLVRICRNSFIRPPFYSIPISRSHSAPGRRRIPSNGAGGDEKTKKVHPGVFPSVGILSGAPSLPLTSAIGQRGITPASSRW
jgi:hypothetical protein